MVSKVRRTAFHALGEDLVHVVRGTLDNGEHTFRAGVGNGLMEEVPHAMRKGPGRLIAQQRLYEPMLTQEELESVLVARRAHGMQTVRNDFRVAVFAAW